MPAKLFVLAFLVILFQLNQLTLGEELTYLKPICNGTERAWTDQQIFDQCSNNLWSHTIYNARDMVKYKTCIDSKMGEVFTVPACCEGYKMVKNDNNRCELDCQRCKHGECDGGECSCAIGFGGKWCDTPCPAANFGLQCEHNCECLTSQNCNPNYQQCKCDADKTTAECRHICKCHSHQCKDGLIGKNCTIPCPEGRYGRFCSKTCSCVKGNTRECLKEFGDCVCKDRFYGLHCEHECTGALKCGRSNRCWCELTLEQKLELVITNSSRTQNYLIVSLVGVSAFLLIASFLVCRYKIKSRRLKNELKNYSLRYSSNASKVVLNNAAYSNSLLNDRSPSPTNSIGAQPTKKGLMDALTNKSLFNKTNWMSKDWLKRFNSETLNEENDKTYCTVGELNGANSKVTKNDLDV